MTQLSHEARLVIDDGKDAHEPTKSDRLRVTESLARRLGVASLGLTSVAYATTGVAASHSLSMLLKVIGGLSLVALGGGLYAMSHKSEVVQGSPRNTMAVQASPSVTASASPMASTAADPLDTPELAVEAQPSRESTVRQSHSRSDSLGEEVAILTQAGKELHSGRPEAALKTLDEHQRRFPSGALALERTAARIQALCALGRTAQAAAESARYARSPQIALAARACVPSEKK